VERLEASSSTLRSSMPAAGADSAALLPVSDASPRLDSIRFASLSLSSPNPSTLFSPPLSSDGLGFYEQRRQEKAESCSCPNLPHGPNSSWYFRAHLSWHYMGLKRCARLGLGIYMFFFSKKLFYNIKLVPWRRASERVGPLCATNSSTTDVWIVDWWAKWGLPHSIAYPFCDQNEKIIQHLLIGQASARISGRG
jgi:hypothetical protein